MSVSSCGQNFVVCEWLLRNAGRGYTRSVRGPHDPQEREGLVYPHKLSTPVGNMGMHGTCEPCVVIVMRGVLHRPRLGFDSAGEVGYLIEQASTLRHQLANLPVSVHHRCVIPAPECLADLRK